MNTTQNTVTTARRVTLSLSGQKEISQLLQQALFEAGFVIDAMQFPLGNAEHELSLTMFNGKHLDFTTFETPLSVADLGFAIAADSYGYVLAEAASSHYVLSMTTPSGDVYLSWQHQPTSQLAQAVEFTSYAQALDLIKSLHQDGYSEPWEISLRRRVGPCVKAPRQQ